MIDTNDQLEYIRTKLSFLGSKVERDNSQKLYNINNIYENVFLHLLNCSFDYNLEDANRILHSNFPAIDLIDHKNNLVIQITSTLTTKKIYNTNTKLQKLDDISSYKLKMCYISRKPSFTNSELKNIEKIGLTNDDLLGIDDIITVAHSNSEKRKDIYNLLLQRIDSKAFNLDIEKHFNKYESQLNNTTTNKFHSYNQNFKDFINSDKNVLEVYAVGGNGKSHLLKHLALLDSNYTPVLFTKQDNVESDLKHLDPTEQYLFIYDDIDRFLDKSINSIFSFVIDSGSKIIISYRAASKPLVEEEITRFNSLKTKEIHIIWNKDEIKDLILSIEPNTSNNAINNINNQFNSNPYLITQALKGGIDEIKNFSKKTLSDSNNALQKFNIKKAELEEMLYRIALLSPCPKNLINENDKDKIEELLRVGILRELNNKIRFNPDILGDLYLTKFVNEYKDKYRIIAFEYIEENLELIITNLSYVLTYGENKGLNQFFRDIIKGWEKTEDYKSSNLRILYRISQYAPLESFRYLKNITNTLSVKENEYPKGGVFTELVSKISEVDFNNYDEYINLGSIVPIINRLISNLKYEKNVDRLKIKHIIDFLTTNKIQSFPKPYFANHNITPVFNDMIIPLKSKSNDVIVEALEEMRQWLNTEPINIFKLDILKNSISKLFEGSIKNIYLEEVIEFDSSKENIRKVFEKAKEIVFKLINSSSIDLKCIALNILRHIGNSINKDLEPHNEQFYYDIIVEIYANIQIQLTQIEDYKFYSELDSLLLDTMRFRKHKDEAFSLFLEIPRTPIFTFNQLLIGKTHVVYDIEEFKDEYRKQKNVKEWIHNKYYNNYDFEASLDDMNLYSHFIKTYKTPKKFVIFINSLYFTKKSDSRHKFTKLLEYWNKKNPQLFKDLAKKDLTSIIDYNTNKAIDDFLFDIGLTTLDIDSINETIEINELKRYVGNSFRNKNINLYHKLLSIFKKEEKENIIWFIDTSFSNIYFNIKKTLDYTAYKFYILELLDLIIYHRITPPFHLIFLLEFLENNNIEFELIKDKIRQILYIPTYEDDLEEIFIDEDDLLKIFFILDYNIEDILARIFWKILNIRFNEYNKDHNIQECYLIENYIKDYKKLIYLVFYYYDNFTYTEKDEDGFDKNYKIDINYFLIGLKKEYLEKSINELIENNDKEKVITLIKVIPIKSNYKKLIVDTLNFLEDDLKNEDIINLLIKDRIPKSVYEHLLEDQTSNINKSFTFDYVYKEISEQEELYTYINENITNIDILTNINELLNEIKDTKKSIQEINLEQLIT